jgi:transcriptional regulator with XRE-family HTH domain
MLARCVNDSLRCVLMTHDEHQDDLVAAGDEWDVPHDELTPSEVARRRIRERRLELGLSQEYLAQEVRRCPGVTSMTRDVLASFESGRRSTLSVDELCAFAWALGTSPFALLLPARLGDPDVDEFMAVGPGHDLAIERRMAAAWLRGEESVGFQPHDFLGERLAHMEMPEDPKWQAIAEKTVAVRDALAQLVDTLGQEKEEAGGEHQDRDEG